MKRSTRWALGLCLLLHAAGTAAQTRTSEARASLDRVISVDLQQVTLEAALRAVAEAGQVRLSYSRDLLPLDRQVSLGKGSMTVREALRSLLAGTGVQIAVTTSGQVVLAPLPVPAQPLAHADPGLVGRVVDAATGLGLPGVTVSFDTGGPAAQTDDAGRYRLGPAGPPVSRLRADRFGYESAVLPLGSGSDRTSRLDFALNPIAVSLGPLDVVGEKSPALPVGQAETRTTVTASDIAGAQIRRIDELFRGLVPGMVAWDAGASPILRFGGIRGATSLALNLPKVYVDGVEIANPLYLGSMDPASIERIEVIRGPQGAALYGSNAIGGVVQIVTKKGAPDSRVHTTVEARTAAGQLGGGLDTERELLVDNAVALSLATKSFSVAGGGSLLRTGRTAEGGGERLGGYFSARGGGNLLRAEASVRHSEHRWETPLEAAFVRKGVESMVPEAGHPQEVRQDIFGLALHLAPTPWLTNSLTLGYDRSFLDVAPERFVELSPADEAIASTKGDISRKTARLASRFRLGGGEGRVSSITVGGEVGELLQTTGDGAQQIRSGRQDIGAFSSAEIALGQALSVTGGIRAEHNSTFGRENELVFLPSLGASFVESLGPVTFRARVAYGRAIRPPAVNAAIAFAQRGFEQQANPALEPESQSGIEGGFDLAVGRWLSMEVTRYRQKVHDLVQTVVLEPASPDRKTQLQQQNVGRIRNEGWEMRGALNLPPFQLAGSFSLTESDVDAIAPAYESNLRAGDRIPEVPSHAGTATLNYTSGGTSASFTAWRIGDWINFDWVAIAITRAQNEPIEPRRFRVKYPALIRFDLAIRQALPYNVSAVAKVENLVGSRRGPRDNLQAGTGRVISLGVQIVR